MIRRFRHKGLERLFLSGDPSGVSAQHVARLRRILALLHTSKMPSDMALPGLRLHPLRGSRRGQWAVSVSGNLRLVFEFTGEDATNVDLVDYH
jgi:proteic killer suppression protein